MLSIFLRLVFLLPPWYLLTAHFSYKSVHNKLKIIRKYILSKTRNTTNLCRPSSIWLYVLTHILLNINKLVYSFQPRTEVSKITSRRYIQARVLNIDLERKQKTFFSLSFFSGSPIFFIFVKVLKYFDIWIENLVNVGETIFKFTGLYFLAIKNIELRSLSNPIISLKDEVIWFWITNKVTVVLHVYSI